MADNRTIPGRETAAIAREPMLTVADVARTARVSRSTVLAWISGGELPAFDLADSAAAGGAEKQGQLRLEEMGLGTAENGQGKIDSGNSGNRWVLNL